MRLRAGLIAAMKACNTDTITVLRGAMAAIDNAEAVFLPDGVGSVSGGVVAGSMAGVGSTEVVRRDLSFGEVRALMLAQVGERDAAAEWSIAHGYPERAARMRREAMVLRTFVDGME
ncbi:MAG: hypothetical protein QM589_07020 [Thermomicrobiales bacterium]